MTILTIYAFFRLAAGGVLVTFFSTASTSDIPPAVKFMVSKSLTFVATQRIWNECFNLRRQGQKKKIKVEIAATTSAADTHQTRPTTTKDNQHRL